VASGGVVIVLVAVFVESYIRPFFIVASIRSSTESDVFVRLYRPTQGETSMRKLSLVLFCLFWLFVYRSSARAETFAELMMKRTFAGSLKSLEPPQPKSAAVRARINKAIGEVGKARSDPKALARLIVRSLDNIPLDQKLQQAEQRIGSAIATTGVLVQKEVSPDKRITRAIVGPAGALEETMIVMAFDESAITPGTPVDVAGEIIGTTHYVDSGGVYRRAVVVVSMGILAGGELYKIISPALHKGN